MQQMERRALLDGLAAISEDVGAFSRAVLPARSLRSYQLAFARAVAGSVVGGSGETFAAVFSRQSGKDEGLAQLLAFLLSRYRLVGGSIVVATPALKPQGLIARDRLLARLDSPLTRDAVRVRDGTTVELGRASVRYLSAARAANSRGNTASLLLVANESQDIEPDVWDAVCADGGCIQRDDVVPRHCLDERHAAVPADADAADLESSDGRKRLFRVDGGRSPGICLNMELTFAARSRRWGRIHPSIRTNTS
ncbi:MAG: hypothetical protein R2849_00015 [Thermomicrobiales bacterium]